MGHGLQLTYSVAALFHRHMGARPSLRTAPACAEGCAQPSAQQRQCSACAHPDGVRLCAGQGLALLHAHAAPGVPAILQRRLLARQLAHLRAGPHRHGRHWGLVHECARRGCKPDRPACCLRSWRRVCTGLACLLPCAGWTEVVLIKSAGSNASRPAAHALHWGSQLKELWGHVHPAVSAGLRRRCAAGAHP